jgi:hypothetical protein
MDLCARVRDTPLLWHHHPNVAVAVAATAAAAAVASAAASPSSGNNCPKNDHEAAMRLAISLVLQFMDMQQHQWGWWVTSAAMSKMTTATMTTIPLLRRPWRNTPICGMQIRMAAGGQIGTIIGIKSGTVHLPVLQSTGGRGQAVPRQRGQWQLPARCIRSSTMSLITLKTR